MKKNFKYISVSLTAIFAMLFCLIPQKATGANYMTMRDITAYDLIAEMNVGINLGNSLDAVGKDETAWGNPVITKNLIKAYKKAGFNTVRLPVTWDRHIDSNGNPYTSWINRVQEVVDWILEEDLYCIINTHHEGSWLHTSSGMTLRKHRFKTLWTAIANRFKNYGDHLLFEGYNEIQKQAGDWSPASEEDYENTNILAQLFVDTVRETGGKNSKRILIVNTYGAIHTTNGFELPKDSAKDKLAVEFHSYDPQQFCFTWGTQTTWGSKNDLLTIEGYCKEFSEFTKNKIPVILGEFGAINRNNDGERAKYAETVVKTCLKYGIKAIWWDNGIVSSEDSSKDTFCLIDRYTYELSKSGIISALVNNAESVTGSTTYPTVPDDTNTTTKTVRTTTTHKATTTTTEQVEKPYVGAATGLKADMMSVNTVKISWDNAANAEGYIVYRAKNKEALKYYKTLKTTEFTDKLSRGKTYKYTIVPYKMAGGDAFFSDVKKSINVDSLAKKISKVSKKVLKTTAKFKINKVVGADKYEIVYSENRNFKKSKSKAFSSNEFTLKGLKKDTAYYTKIRAFTKINGKKVYTDFKKVKIKTKK